MIDLGNIAGLHAHQHELHAYCPRCDRWQELDLARMVRQGYGTRRMPIVVRCRWCDAIGNVQVRPPMPSRSSTGWISPPLGDCGQRFGDDGGVGPPEAGHGTAAA
jgi:hypothetical protein